MKKLPLGIQNFPEIRNGSYIYIDKTGIASDLVQKGKYYFLSRPRRFGKSLFLDTLKCLFEGRKELFENLFIYDRWDWEKKYPVIHIDFARGVLKTGEELKEKLLDIIKSNAGKADIKIEFSSISTSFEKLIAGCYEKYKMPVVILIDEYDKPILDNITDEKTAIEMRNGLRDLYSVIKGMDQYIRFALLTGVSKFSKMNLFSGLNNLRDITLSSDYATICGYTQKDVEDCFSEYLYGVDLEELKNWYNGYSFSGESVYNPYDILLFFQEGKKYKSYWFETGTPTFLIDMIRGKNFYLPDLESLEVTEQTLNTFDVGNIPVESLMFQTGYLTIKKIKPSRIPHIMRYCLGFPNFEVRHAFLNYFIDFMTDAHRTRAVNQDELYGALEEQRVENLEKIFRRLFSGIPYNVYVKNSIADYEGFYISVIYAYFYSLGVDIRLEDASSRGRADMVVLFPQKTVYIFEFKVTEEFCLSSESSGKADVKTIGKLEGNTGRKTSLKPLEQIKAKRYFEKYIGAAERIFIIGAEFSKNQRNLTSFEWEEIK